MALAAAPESKAKPKLRFKLPQALTFPFVLLLIVIGFYWKLVFTYQFDWLWGPDLAFQVLPWFEEGSRQLAQGHLPLWDPHAWLGQPLLAQAQPGAAYPLNWLLWLVARYNGHLQIWGLQWYYIAIHYMAALFTYLLCRDLGRSRAASLIAGAAYSLLGYMGWVGWPQMMNGAVWTPLVFLFLLRAVRGLHARSSAALSGACLGMAWLSGHHQVPIFLTLASSGVWIYFILRNRRVDWHMARLGALATAFGPIVGALQILPAQELGRVSLRWVGARNPVGWNDVVPYYVHAEYSFPAFKLAGILFPGFDTNSTLFFGVCGIALALLGVALAWKQPFVKLFAALALGGLLYALGRYDVFQGFIYAVAPWVEKARTPAMASFLFHAGLAVLAAFGVDGVRAAVDSPLQESSESAATWIRRVTIGSAGFGVFIGATIVAILFARRFSWDSDDRAMLTPLIALLLSALLYGWRTRNVTGPQAVTLLMLLLLFEAGNQSVYALSDRDNWNQHQFVAKVWGNSDIAQFLSQQQKPFRVETKTDDIHPNWGDYYGFDVANMLLAGVTENSRRIPWWPEAGEKLEGIKYVLTRDPPQANQRQVFEGASGIKVYENTDVFPRAWAVGSVVTVPESLTGEAFLRDHSGELRSQAFVTSDAPKLSACAGEAGQVQVLGTEHYDPENVRLRAAMACDGMVVLSDTFYPGWYADMDGQPARIYEVDLALRGVLVPKGAHTVTFSYRPRTVSVGGTLTLAGLIAVLCLVFVDRKS